ncbi:hypothetical protein Bdiaspc4_25880 [Bradyrhizobium diazoefficiens]|nr:hypothetical protein CO678_21390 [Bradyrhizobium diazoefficiens]QBP23713.1 hypothetical protein Bdiaspc4_25880 [Bradyrhizobium diazoefficiens]
MAPNSSEEAQQRRFRENHGAGTMLTKSLLALTLLLAVSASAHAGSTISDRSYWPNEARQTSQSRTFVLPQGPYSALAYDRQAPELPATAPAGGASGWRYQGGPKSH